MGGYFGGLQPPLRLSLPFCLFLSGGGGCCCSSAELRPSSTQKPQRSGAGAGTLALCPGVPAKSPPGRAEQQRQRQRSGGAGSARGRRGGARRRGRAGGGAGDRGEGRRLAPLGARGEPQPWPRGGAAPGAGGGERRRSARGPL